MQTPFDFHSHLRACLIAGAVGDALGLPVQYLTRRQILQRYGKNGLRDMQASYGQMGAISDETQLTLFTAEGLLRARLHGQNDLLSSLAAAYQRWLATQTGKTGLKIPFDGLLWQQKTLHNRRAPSKTTCAALEAMPHLGARAKNQSKSSAAMTRVAPIGLFLVDRSPSEVFELAENAAALTHAHASATLSAGTFAVLIQQLLRAAPLPAALACARDLLRLYPCHTDTLQALELAETLIAWGESSDKALTLLGTGKTAAEALAISVYCALSASYLEEGLLLAINQDGKSNITGALTGQLLGGMFGEEAIPATWTANLECLALIGDVADDLYAGALSLPTAARALQICYPAN